MVRISVNQQQCLTTYWIDSGAWVRALWLKLGGSVEDWFAIFHFILVSLNLCILCCCLFTDTVSYISLLLGSTSEYVFIIMLLLHAHYLLIFTLIMAWKLTQLEAFCFRHLIQSSFFNPSLPLISICARNRSFCSISNSSKTVISLTPRFCFSRFKRKM